MVIGIVRLLVKRGVDIEVQTSNEETALIAASFEGHLGIVRLLIDSGALIDTVNAEGFSPVIAAASNGYIDIVNFLTRRGAKAEELPMSSRETLSLNTLSGDNQNFGMQESEVIEDGSMILYELISAAIEGRLSSEDRMISQGIDVKQHDEAGRTALMEASAFGRNGVVARLIKVGANVNSRDNQGLTPLMLATLEGREGVVRLLIENDANVNAQDGEGITALMLSGDCLLYTSDAADE